MCPVFATLSGSVVQRGEYGRGVSAYVFCNNCGHRNPPQSAFCSACGAILDQPVVRTITLPKADPMQDAPGPEDNVQVDLSGIARGTGILVVRSGDRSGERFTLRAGSIDVGRHPDSSICLDDVTVSRRHARIENRDGEYRIEDLGSLNGTYVNQQRIDSGELQHGDELQIGKFRMVFFDGRE